MKESPFYNLTTPFNCTIQGYEMAQNIFAAPAWMQIIVDQKPDLVIEIGTGFGGFSSLIKKAVDYYGGTFLTFEKNWALVKYQDLKPIFNDVFEHPDFIQNKITENKQVFILCDGGDKIREFKTFAPMLKKGDVIAAHDYCEVNPDPLFWSWVEINDANIADCCKENGLYPFMPAYLKATAWVAKIKYE